MKALVESIDRCGPYEGPTTIRHLYFLSVKTPRTEYRQTFLNHEEINYFLVLQKYEKLNIFLLESFC